MLGDTDRTCLAAVWELLGLVIPKCLILNGAKGSAGLERLFGTHLGIQFSGFRQLQLVHLVVSGLSVGEGTNLINYLA